MEKQTKLVHTQALKTHYREHSTPLYLTSSFTFEDAQMGKDIFDEVIEANVYSRYSNPTVQEFVDKVCILEEAEEGIATATGMAAIFGAFAGLLETGDHVVSSRAIFSSSHQILTQILPKWGISTTYVDASAEELVWAAAIKPTTKVIFLETPSNPNLEIVDLSMIQRLAQKHKLWVIVDNCFATPLLQIPTRYGADLVVHSATKFMDGQGRILGGIVVGRKELMEKVRFFCRQTGSSMSPFNAWVLSKSMETLSLRMERHCENAFQLAMALEKISGVKKVNYPYLASHPQYELARQQMLAGGALITIELEGGFDRVNHFSQLLKIPSLTSNLGDSRTTVTNPYTTTHSKVSVEDKKKLDIFEGTIRISVGLEDIKDLTEDFKQAILGSVEVCLNHNE